jgi:hypothetical protein
VLVLWSIRLAAKLHDDATARRRRCDPQTRNERDREDDDVESRARGSESTHVVDAMGHGETHFAYSEIITSPCVPPL